MQQRSRSDGFVSPITFWADDEWVGPKDLFIALCAAERFGDSCRLFEVGLWRGGWLLHMAKNLGLHQVSALDPYPGLGEIRASTIERFVQEGIELALYSSWEEVPDVLIDVAHVDGEHSEAAALRDLESVARRLSDRGIIAVDDWMRPHRAGVNSAVHMFLREWDYRIVALTEFKAYLVREAHAEGWHSWLQPRLERAEGLRIRLDEVPFGLSSSYSESHAVLGFEPLVWIGKPNSNLKPV